MAHASRGANMHSLSWGGGGGTHGKDPKRSFIYSDFPNYSRCTFVDGVDGEFHFFCCSLAKNFTSAFALLLMRALNIVLLMPTSVFSLSQTVGIK